jgi:hypothetical protein
VAYAYAENYPEDTDKLMRMVFPHPDDSLLRFRCCRRKALSATSWDRRPLLVVVRVQSGQGIAGEASGGYIRLEQDWLYNYLLVNDGSVNARESRRVRARIQQRQRDPRMQRMVSRT